MALITIDDKVQYEENPLPDINKWTAADINHFKSVINENAVGNATPDVSGGVINLPMTNQEMIFVLGNIVEAKTFTFSDNKAKKFSIKIPITVLPAPLTWPASVVMSDSRKVGQVWTPEEIGTFYGKAVFDGTNWLLEIPLIPAV